MKTPGSDGVKQVEFRLKIKLLVSILVLETILMTAIIMLVNHQMRDSILEEFFKRGLSVTHNLVAANNDFVLTYNYPKVVQNLESAVKEHGLLYATLVFFDGEVASYKGREELKQVVTGPLHERTLGIEDALIQYGRLAGQEFCDIAVPIFLKGENWGTVRVGFSLADMHAAIAKTRLVLLVVGVIGLLCGYLASVLLASRISRQIGDFVEYVKAIFDGEYGEPIIVNPHDEFGYLKQRFAAMRDTAKAQFKMLTDANQQLVASNANLRREIIAERQQREEEILYLTSYDTVTGLPNRALLKEYLSKTLSRIYSHQRPIALLCLDINQFKRINDIYGYSAGDWLLCKIAKRLSDCIRRSDCLVREQQLSDLNDLMVQSDGNTVARLSGDEFIIILNGISCEKDCTLIVRRIQQALSEPFTIDDNQIYITTSMGISLYHEDGEDVDSLLKQANMAMHYSKTLGRNQYQFYSAAINTSIEERVNLENDLRSGLEDNQFVLHYQPKADAQSGQIVSMEALVRWVHPQRGMVSPADFIPIAEETGLIIPLGEWVLRTACAQAKAWQAISLSPLRISVNLSAVQFKQKGLTDTVAQILQETDLDPTFLELELTESSLMDDIDNSIIQLKELQRIGVQLSIDDFGTGYSSLNYLRRFPIDTIKIDQSFVRDITSNSDGAVIVNALIALGHSLRLKVVAEGVEEEAQLEFLRKYRCDEFQGYLLARPLPPAAFLEFTQSYRVEQQLPSQDNVDQGVARKIQEKTETPRAASLVCGLNHA